MPYNYTLLVGSDYKFNTTAYQDYSPLYLSASFMMTYMLAIALATCAITHTILYHGPKIVKSFKAADIEKDDVHAKLMRAYPEVPMWFVLLFSFSSLLVLLSPDAFSTGSLPLQVVRRIIRCLLRPWDRRCRRELPSFSHHLRIKLSLTHPAPLQAYPTNFPVWGLIIALCISTVYFLPSGYVFAATGQQVRTAFAVDDSSRLFRWLISFLLLLLVSQVWVTSSVRSSLATSFPVNRSRTWSVDYPAFFMPHCYLRSFSLFLPSDLPTLQLSKAFTVETLFMAGIFSLCLKLGHYMKIPPRLTFTGSFIFLLGTCSRGKAPTDADAFL
jgi:hypothetical protein